MTRRVRSGWRYGVVVLAVLLQSIAAWGQPPATGKPSVAAPLTSPGGNYYVATTGSNGAAGTIGAPWQTVAYAVSSSSAATCGDTIHVRAGTYTGYVQIGKNGCDGNPITLKAYSGEDCTTANIAVGCAPSHAILTTGGALGNILFDNRTNWTIQGLEIKDSSGGAGIYFDDGGSSTGTVRLLNNLIHNTDSGDNASCIFIQRQRGAFIIQNNVMYDCNGAAVGGNNTGIVVFGHINTGFPGTVTFTIQHNEIYNEQVPIKFKHYFATDQTVSVDVSYNYLHGYAGKGGVSAATGAHCSNKTVRFHHNVIVGDGTGIGSGVNVGDDFSGSCQEIDHNTIYGTEQGLYICIDGSSGCLASDDTSYHDNIIRTIARTSIDTGLIVLNKSTSSTPFAATIAASDYNCYSQLSGSATSIFRNLGTDYTIANWRTLHSIDANTVAGTPTFVSAAREQLQLLPGSPCKNLRSDGHDQGAYELGTEVVGVEASTFFTENFETNLTGSFNSTNFGALSSQGEFSRQSGTVLAGSWSLAHAITSGNEPGYATQHFGDAGAGPGSGGPIYAGTSGLHYPDLYVQWKVRYSAGFNFNVNFKQFIIGTEDNHDHAAQGGPNSWAADYLTIYTSTAGALRAEYNRKHTSTGAQFVDIFPNLGATDTMTTNVTHTVEVRRKLNTIGSADGVFQMWLDGTLIASYDNITWRVAWDGTFGTNDTYKNNFVLLSDYANLPGSSGTVYYDDIKFSTGRIGS